MIQRNLWRRNNSLISPVGFQSNSITLLSFFRTLPVLPHCMSVDFIKIDAVIVPRAHSAIYFSGLIQNKIFPLPVQWCAENSPLLFHLPTLLEMNYLCFHSLVRKIAMDPLSWRNIPPKFQPPVSCVYTHLKQTWNLDSHTSLLEHSHAYAHATRQYIELNWN